MEKEIILMAKSSKKKNYCVAGIDQRTGKWVRIVSEDASIQHAVKKSDIICDDGHEPEVLDIVRVTCKGHKPNSYQSENYVLDDKYYWEHVGRTTLQEVFKLHQPEKHEELFYSKDKRISDEEIAELEDCSKYSLVLIKPSDVVIHVQHWPERVQVTASFTYNSHRYQYVNVTDPIYLEKYKAKSHGNYRLGPAYFVMSLGDTYETDGHHYKLIATIFEQ